MPAIWNDLNGLLDRRTKRQLGLALVGSTVASLADMAAIALIFPLMDLATGNAHSAAVTWTVSHLGLSDQQSLLPILAAVTVGLFIAKDLAQLRYLWWTYGMTAHKRVEFTSLLLHHYMTMGWTRASQRSTAELIRISDVAVGHVFNYVISGIMAAFSALVTIVLVVGTLIVLSPWATIALLLYFGAAALLYVRLVKPRAAAAGEALNESSEASYHAFLMGVGGLKEVMMRGSHKEFTTAYEIASTRGAEAWRRGSFFSALPRYSLEILFILAFGFVLIIGAGRSDGNPLALLAVFVAAGLRTIPALSTFLSATTQVRIGLPSLAVVHDEVVAARSRESSAPPAPSVPSRTIEDGVELTGVSFTYPDTEQPVLRDITLRIPRGSAVALVGESGAGKTTLADLLLGLHRPTAGTIGFDGVDISGAPEAWQSMVGQVPQSVFMLDATIAENVAFTLHPDQVDLDEVKRAVDKAQLTDVVDALPLGLMSQVGERGSRLSGGQIQRIGIARALFRNPQVLVLDEATSALDNETERKIAATLASLHGQVTTVTIAHRLSTIQNVDIVVFLEAGTIAGIGTFTELVASNESFARLARLGLIGSTAGLPGPGPEQHLWETS